MKNIVDKLLQVKKESSKLAKVELLKEFLEDENFRIVVELALDETMHYNISKLPNVTLRESKGFQTDFDNLVDYLSFLSSKQGATKIEKEWLAEFAFDSDWEHIIKCIITKDLKCGAGAKLINQAVPDTLSIFPYMRCSTSSKSGTLEYPAFFQTKEDGLFANVVYNKNKVSFLSRNGNEFIFPEDSLTNDIKWYYPEDTETNVYMGEFRIRIDGKWLPRKTSNGIINKALKKNQTMAIKESKKVHFICWDVVPVKEFWKGECNTPYKERFEKLSFLDHLGETRNHLSSTIVINDFAEGQEHAMKLIEEGEEGGIVKNFKATWKNTTSTEQIKLKAGDLGIENERECELDVVSWYYGKIGTKYENCLGGLICVSSDDQLETKIGGGFSDEDRGFLGWNGTSPIAIENFEGWVEERYLNRIITTRFNEVIKAKTSKKHSLFSARYVEVRSDKNQADDLQYIKDL